MVVPRFLASACGSEDESATTTVQEITQGRPQCEGCNADLPGTTAPETIGSSNRSHFDDEPACCHDTIRRQHRHPRPPQPHDQQQHLRSLFFQGSSFSIERVLKKFSATCAQQKWYDQHYSTLQNCAKQFNGLFLQLHT